MIALEGLLLFEFVWESLSSESFGAVSALVLIGGN
jgi:hypothetical protein